MKKLLTILFGALVALSLFVTTGNTAKAAMADKGCGCPGEVFGAEKNKIIADLISSEEFKSVKQDALKQGSSWNGTSLIQVFDLNGLSFVGVPFVSPEGVLKMYVFINGVFETSIPV